MSKPPRFTLRYDDPEEARSSLEQGANYVSKMALAKKLGCSRWTVQRMCKLAVDPLPYELLPSGRKVFNLHLVEGWLLRHKAILGEATSAVRELVVGSDEVSVPSLNEEGV